MKKIISIFLIFTLTISASAFCSFAASASETNASATEDALTDASADDTAAGTSDASASDSEETEAEVFETKSGKLTLEDYSRLEIEKESYEVTEDEAKEYADSVLKSYFGGDDEFTPTDEMAKQYAEENLDNEINNLDEFYEFTHNYLETNALQNALFEKLLEKSEIIEYNTEIYENVEDYYYDNLTYYAVRSSSFDPDTFAKANGYESADAYKKEATENVMSKIMVLEKVADDLGIEITEEDENEIVTEYLVSIGYEEVYTPEEFIQQCGEGWLYILTGLNLLYERVMTALEPYAVVE